MEKAEQSYCNAALLTVKASLRRSDRVIPAVKRIWAATEQVYAIPYEEIGIVILVMLISSAVHGDLQ